MHKYTEDNKKTWKKYLQNSWIKAVTLFAYDGWSEIVLLNEDKDGIIILANGVSDEYTKSIAISKEKFEDRYGIKLNPKMSKQDSHLNELLNNMHLKGNVLKTSINAVNRGVAYELAIDCSIVAVSMFDKKGKTITIADSTNSHSHRMYGYNYIIDDMYDINDSSGMHVLKGEDRLLELFDNDTTELLNNPYDHNAYVSYFSDDYQIIALDLKFDNEEDAQNLVDSFNIIEKAKVDKTLKRAIMRQKRHNIDVELSKLSPEERKLRHQRNIKKQIMANSMYSSHDTKSTMADFVRGRKKY